MEHTRTHTFCYGTFEEVSQGLNFWYGIFFFLIVVSVLAIIGGILGWAAIRLSVRDDYFSDPDAL